MSIFPPKLWLTKASQCMTTKMATSSDPCVTNVETSEHDSDGLNKPTESEGSEINMDYRASSSTESDDEDGYETPLFGSPMKLGTRAGGQDTTGGGGEQLTTVSSNLSVVGHSEPANAAHVHSEQVTIAPENCTENDPTPNPLPDQCAMPSNLNDDQLSGNSSPALKDSSIPATPLCQQSVRRIKSLNNSPSRKGPKAKLFSKYISSSASASPKSANKIPAKTPRTMMDYMASSRLNVKLKALAKSQLNASASPAHQDQHNYTPDSPQNQCQAAIPKTVGTQPTRASMGSHKDTDQLTNSDHYTREVFGKSTLIPQQKKSNAHTAPTMVSSETDPNIKFSFSSTNFSAFNFPQSDHNTLLNPFEPPKNPNRSFDPAGNFNRSTRDTMPPNLLNSTQSYQLGTTRWNPFAPCEQNLTKGPNDTQATMANAQKTRNGSKASTANLPPNPSTLWQRSDTNTLNFSQPSFSVPTPMDQTFENNYRLPGANPFSIPGITQQSVLTLKPILTQAQETMAEPDPTLLQQLRPEAAPFVPIIDLTGPPARKRKAIPIDSPNQLEQHSLITQIKVALQTDEIRDLLRTNPDHPPTNVSIKVDGIENMLNAVITDFKSLKQANDKLVDTIDQVNQRLRSASFKINDIPERPQEDIMGLTIDLINTMGVPLNRHEVNRCHRIGPRTNNKTRPILVELTSSFIKKKVFLNRSNLQGTNYQGGFITEDLTPTRSTLLYQCRELTRSNRIESSWSNQGEIFIQMEEGGREIRVKDLKELYEHVDRADPRRISRNRPGWMPGQRGRARGRQTYSTYQPQNQPSDVNNYPPRNYMRGGMRQHQPYYTSQAPPQPPRVPDFNWGNEPNNPHGGQSYPPPRGTNLNYGPHDVYNPNPPIHAQWAAHAPREQTTAPDQRHKDLNCGPPDTLSLPPPMHPRPTLTAQPRPAPQPVQLQNNFSVTTQAKPAAEIPGPSHQILFQDLTKPRQQFPPSLASSSINHPGAIKDTQDDMIINATGSIHHYTPMSSTPNHQQPSQYALPKPQRDNVKARKDPPPDVSKMSNQKYQEYCVEYIAKHLLGPNDHCPRDLMHLRPVQDWATDREGGWS